MKRQLLGTIILLLLGICISAQTTDKTVESIRKAYNDVAEKAIACEADDDQGEYGPLVMNTLSVNSRNHQWRAVGIHTQTHKFFYKGGDSEAHLYPDQLVMVKVERHDSNRTSVEEFLFNDAGSLIFYFQKSENDDQVPAERRVYFAAAKAIRVVEDGKTRDRLSTKDAATVREITIETAKLVQLFKRSIDL